MNHIKFFSFFSQVDFTPELYYLCLSFGIFAVLATGRFLIYKISTMYAVTDLMVY